MSIFRRLFSGRSKAPSQANFPASSGDKLGKSIAVLDQLSATGMAIMRPGEHVVGCIKDVMIVHEAGAALSFFCEVQLADNHLKQDELHFLYIVTHAKNLSTGEETKLYNNQNLADVGLDVGSLVVIKIGPETGSSPPENFMAIVVKSLSPEIQPNGGFKVRFVYKMDLPVGDA
jgi:hypothetical protein